MPQSYPSNDRQSASSSALRPRCPSPISSFYTSDDSYLFAPFAYLRFLSHHSPTPMSSPPFRTKPAVPSHLSNGSSLSDMATQARDKKERESIYSAIENSNRGRPAVNFNETNGFHSKSSAQNGDHLHSFHDRTSLIHSEIEEEVTNHTTDDVTPPTPLATSRAHSPYTQHPTIDFDGLSWPSKLPSGMLKEDYR